MGKSSLLTSIFAVGLLMCSCSNDIDQPMVFDTDQTGETLTFTLRMPTSGDKVSYSRAEGEIHVESEYTINQLSLYEYAVEGDSEKLIRVIKSNGTGKNVIDLSDIKADDHSYTFSINVPADYIGKNLRYRFVANDEAVTVPVDEESGESYFSDFMTTHASKVLETIEDKNPTADKLSEDGIAMTGVAKDGANDFITISPQIGDKTYAVEMERIVSRIDIRYRTPNLRITSAELRNAPKQGFLFTQTGLPILSDEECLTLGHHSSIASFPDFLHKAEADEETGKKHDEVNLEHIFYLYERKNSEDSYATVHIEYEIDYNDKTDEDGARQYYHGAVDIPFKAGDKYVDAVRNHRYTIVLGNGDDPVSGRIKFQILVDDWVDVAVSEEFTSDDELITVEPGN